MHYASVQLEGWLTSRQFVALSHPAHSRHCEDRESSKHVSVADKKKVQWKEPFLQKLLRNEVNKESYYTLPAQKSYEPLREIEYANTGVHKTTLQ